MFLFPLDILSEVELLDHMVVLCFVYYSFIIEFEIRNVMPSTLGFLDIALAIQNLLWSHINSKIVFSTSVSKKSLEY